MEDVTESSMLNVCMVGNGMMGVWHSDALKRVPDCQLHTVVGRPPSPLAEPTHGRRGASTEEFAARYGYKKWTTSFDEAVNDPEVDIVIVAGPSQTHADFMPPIDPRTGIPMEVVLVVETKDDQAIVCTGSYYAAERIYDMHVVTDRDSYRVDELRSTLTTADGERPIPTEEENAQLIGPEFVHAVRVGREPAVPGWSVLPAMRVLHRAQENWDAKYGQQVLPGRPVT
jgi:predicted dehydrogenase